MSEAFALLKSPASGADPGQAWFDTIAAFLLGRVELVAGSDTYRFLEIELYYSGGVHPDPFAHCDEIQKECSTWYFHRDEGAYRGGSFKGLDITFGEGAYGGVLIRTMRGPSGVTNGCSLCVDRLLRSTGKAEVAELDGEINHRPVWDVASPLHLRLIDDPPADTWKTARVGLTLKRAYRHPEMKRYIMRPYRYLTDARAVKKGRVHHIIALHKAGKSAAEIRALTGSPVRSIAGNIEEYEAGRKLEKVTGWYGKSLKTADLCQLHGAWSAKHEG